MPYMLLGDGSTGLAGFVGALTDSSTGVTSATLWDQVTLLVPLVVTVVIFAFGFKRIKKIIGGIQNGKAKF